MRPFMTIAFCLLCGWLSANDSTLPTTLFLPLDTGRKIEIRAVQHASVVMKISTETMILVDPVGNRKQYPSLTAHALIIYTHDHYDHFNTALLRSLASTSPSAQILAPRCMRSKIPGELANRCHFITPNEAWRWNDVTIHAVPAYNVSRGKLQFHPRQKGYVGYIVEIGTKRIYFSGDTEVLPDKKTAGKIDLAFVCMNLPWTMDAKRAFAEVKKLAPRQVCPYHYRNRDNTFSERDAFIRMFRQSSLPGIELRLLDFYSRH